MRLSMIEIGAKIKELRKLRGLSQKELAESVGMHQGQYSRIENRSVEPTLSTLEKICLKLKVSVSGLLNKALTIDEIKAMKLEDKLILIQDLEFEDRRAIEIVLDMILSGVHLKSDIADL